VLGCFAGIIYIHIYTHIFFYNQDIRRGGVKIWHESMCNHGAAEAVLDPTTCLSENTAACKFVQRVCHEECFCMPRRGTREETHCLMGPINTKRYNKGESTHLEKHYTERKKQGGQYKYIQHPIQTFTEKFIWTVGPPYNIH